METETLHEGPYIVHMRDFGCSDEQYVKRTHLYIGEEILFEEKDIGVEFVDVPLDIEAHLII